MVLQVTRNKEKTRKKLDPEINLNGKLVLNTSVETVIV